MSRDIALVAIDISDNWEEEIKAHERGYHLDWFALQQGISKKIPLQEEIDLHYHFGSVRVGFNAIIDVVKVAHSNETPIFATDFYSPWGDNVGVSSSLKPFIPDTNIYEKHHKDAFTCEKLAERLEEFRQLAVIGYDGDYCVLETIKGAVAREIQVITSEHLMLTRNIKPREKAIDYFRKYTTFLESAEELYPYLSRKSE